MNFLFSVKSIWNDYRWYVIAAGAVLVVLIAILITSIISASKRKKANEVNSKDALTDTVKSNEAFDDEKLVEEEPSAAEVIVEESLDEDTNKEVEEENLDDESFEFKPEEAKDEPEKDLTATENKEAPVVEEENLDDESFEFKPEPKNDEKQTVEEENLDDNSFVFEPAKAEDEKAEAVEEKEEKTSPAKKAATKKATTKKSTKKAEDEKPAEEVKEEKSEAPVEEKTSATKKAATTKKSTKKVEDEKPAEEEKEEKSEVPVEEKPAEVVEEKTEAAEEKASPAKKATAKKTVTKTAKETTAKKAVTKTAKEEKPVEEVNVAPVEEKEENKEEAPKKASAKKETAKAKGKYEITKDDTGYKYNLKASNGESIIISESYSTLAGCKSAIKRLQENVKDAEIKVEQDKQKNYQFHIVKGSRVVAHSANYSTKTSAVNASQSFLKNVDTDVIKEVEAEESDATVEELVDVSEFKVGTAKSTITIYKESDGYLFKLKANNGQVICMSPAYKAKTTITNAIAKFQEAVYNGKFYLIKDKNGNYQFKLYNANKRLILTGESFDNADTARKNVGSCIRFAKNAQIEEELETK